MDLEENALTANFRRRRLARHMSLLEMFSSWRSITLMLVAATTVMYWTRIVNHIAYHEGLIAAFQGAPGLLQTAIIISAVLLFYSAFPQRIRYYATYYFWNEAAAQDRERESKFNSELMRSVIAAASSARASSSGTAQSNN
jgi:hypothetical protein